MMSWTVEQVLGLAPDAWAAQAARDLAVARKWQATGSNPERTAVWGEYQGSAAQPYRVAIDFTGPGFTCTCPSRKTPCKHALGLMLLSASELDGLPSIEPPAWAAEWLLQRQLRTSRADDGDTAHSEQSEEEQQKRTRRREQRISDGVEDLDRWLQDLVRAGLADAATRPWSTFEQMSARLVDAQAPGLARFVRELGGLPRTASNWPERMLIDVAQLSLLLEAWRRRNLLEPTLQAELRALVGINEPRDAVLARPPVHDCWDVVGRRVLEGERMRVQRTWAWGRNTRRWALFLDFSVAGQPIDQMVVPGLSFEADVHFYSGAVQLRGIMRPSPTHAGPVCSLVAQNIDAALHHYAAALGGNPWLERGPMALSNVVPHSSRDDEWWLRDTGGRHMRFEDSAGWQLLALAGGRPLDVFGEWDGFLFLPLSACVDGSLVQLSPRLTL